jgi:hypothetical protein
MEMSSLFHKTVATDFMIKNFWIWLIGALWAVSIGLAQEPVTANPEDQKQEGDAQPADQTQSETQEPIPVPIQSGEEVKSLGAQTFVDDVFQNTRNHWGFTLSAYQAYTSDISSSKQRRDSSGITAFMPRTFLNFGKRKSRFHIDLGAGYRIYNRNHDLDSWDYYGDTQYSLQLSKRTSFQLADQFTSSFNDAWSFLSLYSPAHYNTSFSNEVLFNRQRINRNSLQAELDFRISRKAQFEVFSGYNAYVYPQNTLTNSNALEAGGSISYQLTKWLYLSSSFSTYFNLSGRDIPDTRIYHFQAGGLEFRLSHSWRIWADGGVDISDYAGGNQKREHINAGIAYTSRNNSFSLTYQRGFTSAIGISKLLMSDVANVSYGYRINSWMRTNLQTYYYRSREINDSGLLETLSGGGGFEFALRRDLSLTLNAYYQNQRTKSFSVEGLGLNRFSGFLGLQYVFPARKRSEY